MKVIWLLWILQWWFFFLIIGVYVTFIHKLGLTWYDLSLDIHFRKNFNAKNQLASQFKCIFNLTSMVVIPLGFIVKLRLFLFLQLLLSDRYICRYILVLFNHLLLGYHLCWLELADHALLWWFLCGSWLFLGLVRMS